jgi:hypothetical protein
VLAIDAHNRSSLLAQLYLKRGDYLRIVQFESLGDSTVFLGAFATPPDLATAHLPDLSY